MPNMSPSTLANAFSKDSSETAVIVPGNPALHISYKKLSADVKAFQQRLADVGVSAEAAVRIRRPYLWYLAKC
jgi:ABC-type uncharacterized transport system auxiliary subunit